MDNREHKEPAPIGVEASAEIVGIMPVWDPNLIWDEGGWPVGCVEWAEAPRPEPVAR
jgi:hypothetical protein